MSRRGVDASFGREERRLETDLDDDEQASALRAWQTYIEDPPEVAPDFSAREGDARPGGVGISRGVRWEARRGERDELIPPQLSAEQQAMHVKRRP